jgi:hypothetical protein
VRQFDYFEFAGLIVPGAIFLIALALLFPRELGGFLDSSSDGWLKDIGLLLAVGYVIGHLLQAFGTIYEDLFWEPWERKPSYWVWEEERFGTWKKGRRLCFPIERHEILNPAQKKMLLGRLRRIGALNRTQTIKDLTSGRDWWLATRQVRAVLEREHLTNRIDMLGAVHALSRSLAAAALILFLATSVAILRYWFEDHKAYVPLYVLNWLVLPATVFAATYRMHRAGVQSNQELLINFLALKSSQISDSKYSQDT